MMELMTAPDAEAAGRPLGKRAVGDEQAEQGSEQVLDDRGDDRGERGADDHANGHVQDVPAHGEFLEFLKEFFHDGFLLYKLYNICITK